MTNREKQPIPSARAAASEPEPADTADDWQAFHNNLRRYVRRRVDAAAADDVLGDILLRLVEHRDALRHAPNPVAWMYRVAANAIVDHHRRGAVETRVLDRSGDGQAEKAPAPPIADESAASELSRCMIPLIRGLPDRYAEALLLTDIEGVTQAEAARRLGLSTSGMKSRVQRGRVRLRKALLRCCRVEVGHDGVPLDYEPRQDIGGCRPSRPPPRRA